MTLEGWMSMMMETAEAELCIPHLLNSSCRKPQTNTFEARLVIVLLTVISLLTASLNLLVIISIAHFRQLHSTTNLILLSLAVSDFLIGLVVMPVLGYMWRTCWYFGDLLCALFYLLPTTLVMASVGTVVLISVDRYLAISDPLHYQTRMTEKVVRNSIFVCWINGILYAFFMPIDNWINPDKYRACHGECMTYFSIEADVILAFVFPVSTIVVLYMRVFVMAVSQARAMRSHVTTMPPKTTKKSEIKAARNLGILVLVYLLCYCPFYCVAYSKTNILILGTPIEKVMIFLVFLNSCLNPLIYAMLYPWFRKTIKLIVTLQILKQGSCDFLIL